jgi:hypothetical protein
VPVDVQSCTLSVKLVSYEQYVHYGSIIGYLKQYTTPSHCDKLPIFIGDFFLAIGLNHSCRFYHFSLQPSKWLKPNLPQAIIQSPFKVIIRFKEWVRVGASELGKAESLIYCQLALVVKSLTATSAFGSIQ